MCIHLEGVSIVVLCCPVPYLTLFFAALVVMFVALAAVEAGRLRAEAPISKTQAGSLSYMQALMNTNAVTLGCAGSHTCDNYCCNHNIVHNWVCCDTDSDWVCAPTVDKCYD